MIIMLLEAISGIVILFRELESKFYSNEKW